MPLTPFFDRPARRGIAAALLAGVLVAASPAAAQIASGPLCRDSKGLFTPCPRDARGAVADTPVDHASSVVRQQKTRAAHVAHHRAHPDAPEKPGLFGMGKLCRGDKGRMTPCPR